MNNGAPWFLTVDGREGHLWQCRENDNGFEHFVRVDGIETRHEEHQRGRPSPLAAKTGHTNASRNHEDEEMRHRFAKDVAAWLDHAISSNRIERLHLFAPPRFLGELRKVWNKRIATIVDEHHGDLCALDPESLRAHPAVVAVLGR